MNQEIYAIEFRKYSKSTMTEREMQKHVFNFCKTLLKISDVNKNEKIYYSIEPDKNRGYHVHITTVVSLQAIKTTAELILKGSEWTTEKLPADVYSNSLLVLRSSYGEARIHLVTFLQGWLVYCNKMDKLNFYLPLSQYRQLRKYA